MILVDVNLVLAAQRSDHPNHQPALTWFEELLDGEEQFGVPATVWASFLRLTTNRRLFLVPTPIEDAFDFIRATIANQNHVSCEPGVRHLDLLLETCVDADCSGDMIPDAVLAAIAREHGASLASFDRDFARFEALNWIRP